MDSVPESLELRSIDLAQQATALSRTDGEAAHTLATKALTLRDDTSGEGWHIAWRCLGGLAWAERKIAVARDNYALAVEHRRIQRPQSRRGLIVALDDLGLGYYYAGPREAALPVRREALQLAEMDPAVEAELLRQLRRRLAQSYQAAGVFDEAERLYALCRPEAADNIEAKIGWLNAMALLEEDKGDIALAADWYEQIVDLLEAGGSEEGFAAALGNAVQTRLELDQHADAARLLRRLRAACRSDRKLASQLALLDVRTQLLRARDRFDAAIAVTRRAFGLIAAAVPDHGVPPDRVAIFADLLHVAGRNAEAGDLLEKALSTLKEGIGSDATNLRVELALQRLVAKDYGGSRLLLVKALEAEVGQPRLERKWAVFSALADVAHAQSKPRAAALLGKLALASIRPSARALNGDELTGWLRPRMATYDRILNRLMMVGRVPEALALQVRRSQELARELGSRRSLYDRTVDNMSWRAGEEALRNRLQTLEQRLRPVLVDGEIARVSAAAKGEIRAWLEDVWEERFDQAPSGLASSTGIREKPAAGASALLCYLPHGDGLRGTLILDGGEVPFEVPQSAEWVAGQTRRLRTALEEGSADWFAPARRLHEALIAPIAPHLASCRRLDIAVSGMFSFIPFAALHDGGAFLVERVAIALRAGQRQAPPQSAFAVQWASAAFATTAGDQLPGAVAEARNVAAKLKGKAFIEGDFTAERLKSVLAEGVELLHIATHFDYVPGRPHRSSLLLGNGERLALSTLSGPQFDFSTVKLLVLSGCETGVSDTLDIGLEGLAGLLQSKGASTVVATLWRVDDRQAEGLMAKFYEALLRPGESDPVQALAKAQTDMLREHMPAPGAASSRAGGIGRFPEESRSGLMSPADWAGFVVFVASP